MSRQAITRDHVINHFQQGRNIVLFTKQRTHVVSNKTACLNTFNKLLNNSCKGRII